jgi:hypothetical protein
MAITVGGTNITMNDATVQATAFLGERGQVFTGSGTYTIPAGVTAVKVTGVGGGGNGGGASNSCNNAGGGGGGGATVIKWLTGLTPGGTLTVTVGAAGGTTTIATGTQAITTLTATGGSSGGGDSNSSVASGGTATNGDINIKGGNSISQNSTFISGCGGGSFFSPVANGLNSTAANGTAGMGPGGGGGGACANPGSGSRSGGAGGAGVVVFEW